MCSSRTRKLFSVISFALNLMDYDPSTLGVEVDRVRRWMNTSQLKIAIITARSIFKLNWAVLYVSMSLGLFCLSVWRFFWAWPDAAWQTNFLFLDQVDNVVNGKIGWGTFWIGLSDEHALTGYRWFEYFYATFFGLNTHVEIVAYYLCVLALSIAIGLKILKGSGRATEHWLSKLLVFTIPFILFSMVGAGSRGMEIGQYFGVTIFVLLALLMDSSIRLRNYVIILALTVPALTFLLLGGYAAGLAIGLALVSLKQLIRPIAFDPLRRKKLFAFTLIFVVSASAFLLSIQILNRTIVSGGLSQLKEHITRDPFFVVQYFFGGAASSIINSSTLEIFGHGDWLIYVTALLVLLMSGLAGFSIKQFSMTESTVPLILVGSAVGQIVVLMIGRSQGAFWLLSPWYQFHFRIGLVGVIWLLIGGISVFLKSTHDNTLIRYYLPITLGLIALAMGLTVGANIIQWHRQPYERAYFENVQRSLLSPNELTVDSNGYTPLILPLEESKHVIAILKRDHLNVYRNPLPILEKLTGRRDGLLVSGDLGSDGWAGSHFRISVVQPNCRSLQLQIRPFPSVTSLDHFKGSVSNQLKVTENGSSPRMFRLENVPISIEFPVVGNSTTFDFSFSKTWTPLEAGINQDVRHLSSLVDFKCLN
jgi:hypothetical protein